MPVLARAVEESGIATVMVTMLPEIAERFDSPRIAAVEFPFGHSYGVPHDRAMQETVVRTALSLYERDDLPVRVDVPVSWPVEFKTAYRGWQPKEAAPIVAMLKRQVLERHAKEHDPQQ